MVRITKCFFLLSKIKRGEPWCKADRQMWHIFTHYCDRSRSLKVCQEHAVRYPSPLNPGSFAPPLHHKSKNNPKQLSRFIFIHPLCRFQTKLPQHSTMETGGYFSSHLGVNERIKKHFPQWTFYTNAAVTLTKYQMLPHIDVGTVHKLRWTGSSRERKKRVERPHRRIVILL